MYDIEDGDGPSKTVWYISDVVIGIVSVISTMNTWDDPLSYASK